MADPNRRIGTLRCRDLMPHLGGYVDHEISAELREAIDAHLEGCPECADFGSEYARLVDTLRSLSIPEDGDDSVEARLLGRLGRLWSASDRPPGDDSTGA